jgi:UDP-N-acetylglucosamine transferase subunit ALG13
VILVTIGTSDPFDRLLAAVGNLRSTEEIVAQCGASTVRPHNARCVDFLAFDELTELMAAARIVVTHAGAGSVMTALAAGKLPIAVPRLRRHGEAVDDHQLEFGRRLDSAGLLTLVEDPAELGKAIGAARIGGLERHADGALARDIRGFIERRVRVQARHG